jgi:membrane protease YdiL (CAAX protease family)
VLWRKTWQPEIVMTLVGGILMFFFTANLAVGLLRRGGVTGFQSTDAAGSVLLATLALHGAVLVAGFFFLKFHQISLREMFGLQAVGWERFIPLVIGLLLAALPVMFGLKILSELLMKKVGWPVSDQLAVEMLFSAKSIGLKIYLGIFAVVIAPLAEEFLFRGLIFSGLKKMGWPRCAWVGSSLLFAAIHGSAPIFLSLFAFALVLVWLYEKTDGLFAPVLAHSLFNALNLALLLLAQKYGVLPS